MTLRVSNTLSGETEVFEQTTDGTVTLYLCGLTVSDDAHLGHARTWVHTDVMHRWLAYCGYDVRHVENFTDINHKIVARIGEIGEDEDAVATHFIDSIFRDMRALNLKRVDMYPRVTEHIDEIIVLIERLLERGYAYESNGSVYFDVTAFDGYGTLSNQALEEMETQETARLDEKRHPQDFALWKANGPNETNIEEHRTEGALPAAAAAERAITYDSPWGRGRPGWHIECSAMATTHLGETFDIHVAGRDILFPHNENEVAQAVAATDGAYARYWLHTGLLRTKGEKMSSSLQNYFRVADAVEQFGPDVIRTFLLSTVYHADQTFSDAAIEEARERWDRLSTTYERAVHAIDSVQSSSKAADEDLRTAVTAARDDAESAMNDDFNTREAVAALYELTTPINAHLDGAAPYDYIGLHEAIEVFEDIGGAVFGLRLGEQPTTQLRLADRLVELFLALREQERAAGRFERADEIRDELAELGILVEDTEDGATYRIVRQTADEP